MIYNLKSALLLVGTIIAVSNVTPVAKANEWNKETVVTFSAPVEVPGKDLPAAPTFSSLQTATQIAI